MSNHTDVDVAAENVNQNNNVNDMFRQNENLPTPPTLTTAQQTNKDQDGGADECNDCVEGKTLSQNESPRTTNDRETSSEEIANQANNEKNNEETDMNDNDEIRNDNRKSNTENASEHQTDVLDKLVDLKVELPQIDLKASESTGNEGKGDLNVEGGACSLDAVPDAPSSDRYLKDGESIHQIKWIFFNKKQVPVITQNENGPCPLLALVNVLLLQDRVKLTPKAEIVSAGQLMAHLGDCVLQNVPGEEGVSTPSRLNFEQNMGDAMAVMYKLQTGLDVNVRFTGVREFEYTSECIIFDLLHIALYHGWLVDPQNAAQLEAVGKCSYNQLVEKIIVQKTSDQPDLVSQALVAEDFLESSASQLTYHGLCELCTQLKEEELAVLFRNNHFTTLYRHKGELFQLVTDQGFLHESNVVWETLSNVEGDCHFVDSEFRTYTKPDTPTLPLEPSNVPINSEEQIDHDYLVALSLQQEQQQQSSGPHWTPQHANMSDEDLAKQLQEEERQAAMAEANHPQQRQGQRQGQHQQRPQQQHPSGQRQDRSQQRRDEKKSDCCIL